MSRALALLVTVFCLSCASQRDRGSAGLFERATTVAAPQADRCQRFKRTSNAGKACDEALYLAQVFVKKLSTGDQVCLDGEFGERVTGACLARAAVADTASDKVLLEVREAKPDSAWFGKEQTQLWFEEGALVDLYLKDHGY